MIWQRKSTHYEEERGKGGSGRPPNKFFFNERIINSLHMTQLKILWSKIGLPEKFVIRGIG